jgi:hypothetical protein
MKPAQRRIEFLQHVAERRAERCPPADQHIIMSGTQLARPRGRRQPDDLPQPAPHPVTLHRVADLARYGETYADRSLVGVGAPPRLQHEGAARSPRPTGRGPKIAAAFEPLDDGRTGVPLTH